MRSAVTNLVVFDKGLANRSFCNFIIIFDTKITRQELREFLLKYR